MGENHSTPRPKSASPVVPQISHSQRAQVRGALRGVQAKLDVSQPGDASELEADRVAEWIMAAPEQTLQRKCIACEEDETPTIQRSATASSASKLAVSDDFIDTMEAGQPLNVAARNFFESRFNANFEQVRVHTDHQAIESARAIGARAYTFGNDIVFGAGEYQTHTEEGKRLLAHELTHVLQQQAQPGPIQRECAPPQPEFDLAASAIGGEIRRALSRITVPARQPDQPPVPRVDPDRVLAILAASHCFLHDARRAEERHPSLRIVAHELEEIGSHFLPGESLIQLHVTLLAEVVKRIVHEVVHASHGELRVVAATATVGPVTRAEQAVIGEEVRTRQRENEIMQEIYDAGALPRAELTPATRAEVRRDFISGLPHITYQEHAIVEEMKSRYRASRLWQRLSEGEVTEMARILVRDFILATVSADNLSRFTIDDEFVRRHRESVQSLLLPVLELEQALACVRIFRAYGRRINDEMRRRLDAISPSCRLFIDRWHDYIWRNEPYDEGGRRRFFIDILQEEERRIHRPPEPEQSRFPGAWYGCRGGDLRQCFVNLYDNVLSQDENARLYFEWVLIAEAMSKEWQRAGDGGAVQRREIRGRHIEFLRRRIGRPLAGIVGQ